MIKETKAVTTTINWEKPLQTRNGRKVVVHKADKPIDERYSRYGLIEEANGWRSETWTDTGKVFTADDFDAGSSVNDLVNVPEAKKRITGWLNVTPFGTELKFGSPTLYPNEDSARATKSDTAIGRVYIDLEVEPWD